MIHRTLDPEIQRIKDKLISHGWPKFIEQINIKGIHCFVSQTIEFKFPLCAIVGENGTGKSTILKSLACIYRSDNKNSTYYPSDFFPDTAWERLKNIRIDYHLRIGSNRTRGAVRKPTERWKGLTERQFNSVFYFDMSRLVSISSLIGYAKIAKRAVKEVGSKNLDPDMVMAISGIMGRSYHGIRHAITDIDPKKRVSVMKHDFGEFSEFHQGSGETIITDIISRLKTVPDNSLVIIDEVESSLHPRSQRRLIQKLLELSRIKLLQIVLSTHSPYVLEELPPESRILLTKTSSGTEVLYGVSTEFCMSQIDEQRHPELTVCVEDDRSKEVLREMIRKMKPEILARIEIYSVGASDIVKKLSMISTKSGLPFKLIGVVDADQQCELPCLKLPGTLAVEREIYSEIKNKHLDKLAKRIGNDFESVRREVESTMTYPDHHSWCTMLADRLNVPETKLWNDFVSIWVAECLPEVETKQLIQAIDDSLRIS